MKGLKHHHAEMKQRLELLRNEYYHANKDALQVSVSPDKEALMIIQTSMFQIIELLREGQDPHRFFDHLGHVLSKI